METSFTRGGTQVVEGKTSHQNGKMGISEGDSPHLKGSCFYSFKMSDLGVFRDAFETYSTHKKHV